jgi:hypothetical protein
VTDSEGFWTEGRFRAVAYIGCGVLFVGGLYLRFDYDPPAPHRPVRPRPQTNATIGASDSSPGLYRAQLTKDSSDFNVPATSPEDLSNVLSFDSSEPHAQLSPGGLVETRDLKLTVHVGPLSAQFSNGTVRSEHVFLRVENKTDTPVAYRIDTTPALSPAKCNEKGDLAHDAVAIPAHETIERSECIARTSNDGVMVDRVETVVLPALSFFYVSRLFPAHIGLDARATRGHRPPRGAICGNIPEQSIRRAMEKGQLSWRDVIDFYARHNCEKYLFPVGYHAYAKPDQYALPVTKIAPQ